MFWRSIHELLGHADVSATMIYSHVLNRDGVHPLCCYLAEGGNLSGLGIAAADCTQAAMGVESWDATAVSWAII